MIILVDDREKRGWNFPGVETETAHEILELAKEFERHTDRLSEMRENHQERMDSGPDVNDILYDE